MNTEEQASKDLSIPSQRKELLQFAAKNGFTVVKEFGDEGFSAYVDAISRPEFQAMMRYCLSSKVDAVLVWKFDRFSRRMADARLYKSMLARKSVKVISINEPISDDPAGFATERLLEMFAELYSRMLAVDTRRGLRARAERGLWYGGKVSYGYRQQLAMVQGHERQNLVFQMARELEELYQAKCAEYQTVTTTASKRAALVTKISRLYDAIEAGADALECSKRIAQYQQELGALIDESSDGKLEALKRARENIARQLATLKSRETSLLTLPPAVQRELVLTFVERVDITREGLRVTIRYTGGGDGGGGAAAGYVHWGVAGGKGGQSPPLETGTQSVPVFVKGLCPFTLPHQGTSSPGPDSIIFLGFAHALVVIRAIFRFAPYTDSSSPPPPTTDRNTASDAIVTPSSSDDIPPSVFNTP